MGEIGEGLQGLGVDPAVVEAVGILLAGALNGIIAEFGDPKAEGLEDADDEDMAEDDGVDERVAKSIDRIGKVLEEDGIEDEVVDVVTVGLEGAVESITAEYAEDDDGDDADDDDADDDDADDDDADDDDADDE